jgi:orotidine-5'-phosphate decarboxylase
VILDAKRADIGSTNAGYATAAFDTLGADAITVHPYLGRRGARSFLERERSWSSSSPAPPTPAPASSRT